MSPRDMRDPFVLGQGQFRPAVAHFAGEQDGYPVPPGAWIITWVIGPDLEVDSAAPDRFSAGVASAGSDCHLRGVAVLTISLVDADGFMVQIAALAIRACQRKIICIVEQDRDEI
jgi:hypothetical protein